MLDNEDNLVSFPRGFLWRFPQVSQSVLGDTAADLRAPLTVTAVFFLILQVLLPQQLCTPPGVGCSGYSHCSAQHGCFSRPMWLRESQCYINMPECILPHKLAALAICFSFLAKIRIKRFFVKLYAYWSSLHRKGEMWLGHTRRKDRLSLWC